MEGSPAERIPSVTAKSVQRNTFESESRSEAAASVLRNAPAATATQAEHGERQQTASRKERSQKCMLMLWEVRPQWSQLHVSG